MKFEKWLQAKDSSLSSHSIDAVLKLVEEGGTVPFIARYRKEATGALDEVKIQAIIDGKESWDAILKRQEFILKEIEKQEKLSDVLSKKIKETFELSVLEDIYLPFKQKRKTKAVLAKEAGLEPLASELLEIGKVGGEKNIEDLANAYIKAGSKFDTLDKVLKGAIDIVTEGLSERADLRQLVRDSYFKKAYLKCVKTEKAKSNSKFERYFDYSEAVSSLMRPEASHRYLAIRRGWTEEELSLSFVGKPPEEASLDNGLIDVFEKECFADKKSLAQEHLKKAARFAYKVYISSSIATEVHKELKDKADLEAIQVFTNNVRQVLLSPPLGSKSVLGIDPGIRTGCKFAVVDSSGKFLHHGVFHLQNPSQEAKVKEGLPALIEHFKVEAIAVGNGTAGRETESFFKKAVKELGLKSLPVVLVNESGASIYSASEVARKEFADLDLTVRGAISIARRLQDPLAELVKIDPKSIGVGQYQHDVNQFQLKKALEGVVDSCVNQVGVDLNTASEYLLARVAGVGPALAKNIIKHRESKGVFRSRKDLLKVTRFSDKVFEQAAGFLRVFDSDHPLDKTGVHPEQYSLLEQHATSQGLDLAKCLGPEGVKALSGDKSLKERLGEFTFKDVVAELEKPGRDPRDPFESVEFREDISEISDLSLDMICPGVVTNVTNFGAFVDIGVHQDGLVHISQMSHSFVKDPRDVVKPGQKVQVKVIEINPHKNQIALSMRLEEKAQAAESRASQARSSGGRPQRGGGAQPRAKREDFKNNPFEKLAKLNRG